jgi:multiple sugar transport system ATP-binding protein
MATIELRNVTKRFGESITAVDDISLLIAEGEFVVFVGPSGSGKSTTLRMIAGLEDVTSGEILIDDEHVEDTEPQKRDVAMVFQSFALYPHRTVRQNISFPLEAWNDSEADIDEKVRETAEILDIGELLDRIPGELSGGQQQRVALGRALVRDPQAFLLDEPLANLDAKLRKQMRAEVVRLQRELGSTTIHVTHNQEEAMTMGDRVVVMNGGEIQQSAPPKEAYKRPANRFVAGFLGSPSMNFVEGRAGDGQFQATDAPVNVELLPRLATFQREYELTLGIRPENVSLTESSSEYTVETVVDVVELLGDSQVVHATLGGREFLAKIDPDDSVEAGDTVKMHLDPEKLHLFDGTDAESPRVNADSEGSGNAVSPSGPSLRPS